VSADGRTGDGAGILLISHDFFKKYVTLKFRNENMLLEWFFYQKRKPS
jgi:glutamate synthase domain-containing protein 1